MAEKNDDAYNFLTDPWGQAAAAAALTLVPVRKYPGWLKATLGWGGALGTVALVATPGATTKVWRKLSELSGDSDEEIPQVELTPAARGAIALAAGASWYGGWRLSVWSDTAVEKLVRRLRVPAPRLAMGAVAGWVTWSQVQQANERVAAQRVARKRTSA